EGRGWRGFHHHATLCIAAYGFLISERETIPPCGPRAARFIPAAVLSDCYRPRGSAAAARASHPQLNRNHAPPPDCRLGQDSAAMPLLLSTNGKTLATEFYDAVRVVGLLNWAMLASLEGHREASPSTIPASSSGHFRA